MTPYDLIGRGYRLGANFIDYPEGDCVNLARAVLRYYDIDTPEPQRDWYRRLRRGDTEVFREELERWGEETSDLRCGVVALCSAENGYGLAVWFEDGWLSFRGPEVCWNAEQALEVIAVYAQTPQQPLGKP